MEDFVIKKLTFNKKPIPIPADYRPMYKIGLIVLIMRLCCRGDKSTLLKLHLLSWALKSKANTYKLKNYITSNYKTELSVWGIEPALNRALQFAIADNICEIIEGKNYRLTKKGIKFFKMIETENELYDSEKSFLNFIGKNNLTEKRINSISNQWTLFYAKN